jgi:hypothetical protein
MVPRRRRAYKVSRVSFVPLGVKTVCMTCEVRRQPQEINWLRLSDPAYCWLGWVSQKV